MSGWYTYSERYYCSQRVGKVNIRKESLGLFPEKFFEIQYILETIESESHFHFTWCKL